MIYSFTEATPILQSQNYITIFSFLFWHRKFDKLVLNIDCDYISPSPQQIQVGNN